MLAWPGPCVKSYPPHFSVLNPQEKHGGFSCSAQPAWQIITVIVEATQQSSLLSLRKETSVAAKLLGWASGKPDWRRILWYVIRASDFLGVPRRTLPATLQPRHQGICIMKNSYCNIPLVSFFKGLILMFSGCMCTYGTTAASTISGCVWSRLSSSAGGTWMKHILCHQDSGEKASWHWKSVTDALLGHGIIIAN